MKKYLLLFILLTTTTVQILGVVIPQKTLRQIKTSDLKKSMAVLTSDSLEGRATGEIGIEKAAQYIETQFRESGLEPYEENQYRQSVPLWKSKWGNIQIKIGNLTLASNHNFIYASQVTQNQEINKEVVYIGVLNDSTAIPFDITNKIVMVKLNHFNEFYPISLRLKKLEPWAIFFYCPSDTLQYANLNREMMMRQTETAITDEKPSQDTTGLRLFYFPKEMTQTIFGKDHDSIAGILGSTNKIALVQTIKIQMERLDEPIVSYNIIGRIKGKSNKQLAITAHYDHLGRQPDGLICRGADDNGSGTIALLQLAKLFKMQNVQPEYDILFIAFTAEELGLLGSKYFMANENPNQFIANINMDMIGRSDSNIKNKGIYVLGPSQSEWLMQLHRHANHETVNLRLNYKYDGGELMNRSDHHYFYTHSIPVAAFFSGLHPDYHTPSDTMNKILFGIYKQRIKLIFATAYSIAYDPESAQNSTEK